MPPTKDAGKDKVSKDKAGKDKGKKGAGKTPAVNLAEENAKLTEALATANAKLLAVEQKWEKIGEELLNSVDQCVKEENNIINDVNFLTEDQWMVVADHLVVKRRLYEESAESLLGRLETRVTELNMDVARMRQKCLAYEQGLKRLSDCCCMDEVLDNVYKLRIIAGEAFHCFEANDATRKPVDIFSIVGITDREDEDVKRVISDANCLNLLPPPCKYPGDTLIQNMVPELLLYLIKELSLEKISRGDWRTLGVRVGLHQSVVDDWEGQGLEYPAGRVMDEWIKTCPATIRLLYRHLMSPAMRCTMLARRVADFYDVC